MDKLLAHPLLDDGRALAESEAVLVSLMGGPDLTMAEVNRVMEQINRQCEHAQVIMGAAVDETLKGRLLRDAHCRQAEPGSPELPPIAASADSAEQVTARGRGGAAGLALRFVNAVLDPGPARTNCSPKTPAPGRGRSDPKMRQAQLPLAIISKGRFDKSEPTIHKGEDLDIPTYVRRGVALN